MGIQQEIAQARGQGDTEKASHLERELEKKDGKRENKSPAASTDKKTASRRSRPSRAKRSARKR